MARGTAELCPRSAGRPEKNHAAARSFTVGHLTLVPFGLVSHFRARLGETLVYWRLQAGRHEGNLSCLADSARYWSWLASEKRPVHRRMRPPPGIGEAFGVFVTLRPLGIAECPGGGPDASGPTRSWTGSWFSGSRLALCGGLRATTAHRWTFLSPSDKQVLCRGELPRVGIVEMLAQQLRIVAHTVCQLECEGGGRLSGLAGHWPYGLWIFESGRPLFEGASGL
jgi:hypothetical protein